MEEDTHQSLFGMIKSLIGKRKSLDPGADLDEEIHDLMHEGQVKGLISDEESDMVIGVLELKDTKAYNIMVPRTEVSSAPVGYSLGEVIKLINECGHTRIPICKESIDEVVGILHAKDLLKLWGKDPNSPLPPEILRKPHFVPLSQKASELLKDLKERKAHLTIVTDEYGGTAGIITIEDILEEIVGEIQDEHDHDAPLLHIIDENTVSVDARLEVEKLEEHMGITLPEGEFESVGGFIMNLIGRIPKTGEKISYGDIEMTIQSADLRKIDKILIRHQQPAEPPENGNAR